MSKGKNVDESYNIERILTENARRALAGEPLLPMPHAEPVDEDGDPVARPAE